ncbi:MAG: hypothetical protein ACOYXR_09200 [Nitrospirota bacterium]
MGWGELPRSVSRSAEMAAKAERDRQALRLAGAVDLFRQHPSERHRKHMFSALDDFYAASGASLHGRSEQ